MRYLIVSDIHGNLDALQAVLRDAHGSYDKALCCGDLVGYCADPNAVVEWARANCEVVVRGNHDKAAVGLDDLEWFNPVARSAAVWTQQHLTPENYAYISGLPRGPVTVDGFQVFHGFPVDEDAYMVSAAEAEEAFGYVQARVSFFGHTHLQGGFLLNRSRVETIGKPSRRQDRVLLDIDPDCAYLVNPGSVGQPRDGDPRAGYVLYAPEDGFLFYRRVEYDVAGAQRKIAAAGLPPLLAERLAAGR